MWITGTRRARRQSGKLRIVAFPPPELIKSRPKTKNADWEEGPLEGAPFNYDAAPDTFYFMVESVGNLDPDAIIQNGIKAMQQKLAAVIQELTGDDARGDDYEPRSPGADAGMAGGVAGVFGLENGYTTPYANGGNTSTWGAGQATPYGATPYGQSTSGWGA